MIYRKQLKLYSNSRLEKNDADKVPKFEKPVQRYILECMRCLWNTSYVDKTGNLNLSDRAVLCPVCKKGLIEVQANENKDKNTFALPAYLEYVLSD